MSRWTLEPIKISSLALSKFLKRASVLLFNRSESQLPLLHPLSILKHQFFSPLKYLVNLCISKCELPEQGVRLVNLEYFEHGVDGMHAVFFATSTTSTRCFAAELNFVFLAVGSLESQLGGTLLLDEEVSRAESHIIKNHELLGRFGTVRFRS